MVIGAVARSRQRALTTSPFVVNLTIMTIYFISYVVVATV